MIEIELLKLLSDDKIDAVLSKWEGGRRLSRSALIQGRGAALAGGKVDESILLEIERVIDFGPKRAAEIASIVASVLVVLDPKRAGALVERLAHSKNIEGRVGALMCLTPLSDSDLVAATLNQLISDRSKRVREMAVDWIGRHQMTEYASIVESALARESNPALLVQFAKELSLLSSGYDVERRADRIYVTIQTSGGRVSGILDIQNAENLSDMDIAKQFWGTLEQQANSRMSDPSEH